MSGGELCLLQHEVDQIELMTQKILENDVCRGLIKGIDVPNGAAGEDFMLVKRDQHAKGFRCQSGHHQEAAGPVAGIIPVQVFRVRLPQRQSRYLRREMQS